MNKLLTLIILSCLFFLVACGPAASTTTPEPIATKQTFTSNLHPIQFEYPDGWSVYEDSVGLVVTDSDSITSMQSFNLLPASFEGTALSFVQDELPESVIFSVTGGTDFTVAEGMLNLLADQLIVKPSVSDFSPWTPNEMEGVYTTGQMDMGQVDSVLGATMSEIDTLFGVVYDEKTGVSTLAFSLDSTGAAQSDIQNILTTVEFTE